ncbi:MAG TPA: WG repeat-containing protein, partial [Ferruginibacter sp.]|nr:WG repeat-containing protein [Ferruginibacter sp.]
MRRPLLFILLLLTSVVSAQKQTENIIPVQVAGTKFQYVDRKTHQPVHAQLWDETDPFRNGFARVFLQNKFTFVNASAKPISPAVFEDARDFSNHLAAVKQNGKWGFIDENGKAVVPARYEIVYDFDGNVTAVYSKGQWSLLNNKGQLVKNLDITICYGFRNGTARVTKNEQEGTLYPDGRIVYNGISKPAANSIQYKRPGPGSNTSNLAVPCPDNI